MKWLKYLLATLFLVGCSESFSRDLARRGPQILFEPPPTPAPTHIPREIDGCPNPWFYSLESWFDDEVSYIMEGGQRSIVNPDQSLVILDLTGDSRSFQTKNTTQYVYETINPFAPEEENLRFTLYDICSDDSPEVMKIEISIPSRNDVIAIYFRGIPFIREAYINNEPISLEDEDYYAYLYERYVFPAFEVLRYNFGYAAD